MNESNVKYDVTIACKYYDVHNSFFSMYEKKIDQFNYSNGARYIIQSTILLIIQHNNRYLLYSLQNVCHKLRTKIVDVYENMITNNFIESLSANLHRSCVRHAIFQ